MNLDSVSPGQICDLGSSFYNTLTTWCEEPTLWKRLMLGKIEGRRRRELQRTRFMSNTMDMNLSKLQEDSEGQGSLAAVHGIAKSWTWLNSTMNFSFLERCSSVRENAQLWSPEHFLTEGKKLNKLVGHCLIWPSCLHDVHFFLGKVLRFWVKSCPWSIC